jgi:NAD+ synthase
MIGNKKIIREFGVAKKYDIETDIKKRVDFLVEYLENNTWAEGYLIGISGGIDSAVVAALLKMSALITNKKVLAVLTPYHSKHLDLMFEVVKSLDLQYYIRDIGEIIDFSTKTFHLTSSKLQIGNRMARQRMIEWYDISSAEKLIVVGTDHATESVIGYYTKYGDGGVDINPIRSLDKRQIKQLAAYDWPFGNIPKSIINRQPSADLWDGQTDEEEIGLSYEAICDYLEEKDVRTEIIEKIEWMYYKNMHKRQIPFI